MRRLIPGALLLALPGVAPAQSLRVVDSLVMEYRGDNQNDLDTDDDYGVGISKLYLNGQLDDTSLAVQVDTFLFTNYPDVPNPTPANPSAYSSETRLERITLTHSIGDGTLTAGDSHLQLGRGISLSLRKVDEMGTDQALRGGTVGWNGEQVSTLLFGGWTNVANMDGVTQRALEDPDDLLVGGSATLHLGRVDLSAHGLYLRPSEAFSAQYDEDQTVLGGGYVELFATDWLSLYGEGAVVRYRLGLTEEQGTAAYGSADLDLQIVSLLLEGLWLDRFEVAGSYDPVFQQRRAYNQPPTLERIDQEVLDNVNVRGGRAKVSRAFLDGSLVLYLSGMLRRSGTEQALVDAFHGYGGFELTYDQGRSRWYASGGWRNETQNGADFKHMAHAETDWVQSIGGPWALHFTVNHESRHLEERGDYVRGTTLVGVDRGGLGSLMAEIGYDTFDETTRQLYLAGIVAWEVDHWLIVRSIFGSQRGGIKCIGGVCRDFPAFNGVRFEATLQYDVL